MCPVIEVMSGLRCDREIRNCQPQFFLDLSDDALAEGLVFVPMAADEEERLPVLVPLGPPLAFAADGSLDQGDAAFGATERLEERLWRNYTKDGEPRRGHGWGELDCGVIQAAAGEPEELLAAAGQGLFEQIAGLMQVHLGELYLADVEPESAVAQETVALPNGPCGMPPCSMAWTRANTGMKTAVV